MSTPISDLRDRRIGTILSDLAQIEVVVALHGPRSVGKSTVLRSFAASRGVPVIDLDDLEVREATIGNLRAAIDLHTPVCIDEYQHVPEVLDAIKARTNREGGAPGTAVITGSTRQDAIPRTAQSLTGRLHSLTIRPLSQGEIDGTVEDLLPALRADPITAVAALPTSSTTRSEYVDRVCTGGFPMALRRVGPARTRWFDDYVRLTLERDALELARVRERQAFADLLQGLASRTAQVLNLAGDSDRLGIDRKTVEQYVRLLEDLFLIERLPAWGKTLRTRTTTKPKLHVLDSGIAARLMRVSQGKLSTLEPTALTEFGHLLETFIVGELRKQVSWLDERVTLGHWRTSDGDEVDLVIEFDDGSVLAFEVKANERVSGDDFKGMRKLRSSLGDRLIAGIALSTGSRSYTYEDRLHVMPIDRLWRTVG